MTNEDVHSLAAASALDALDADERRRFEAHYPDCDACRTEVGEFRETTARIASAGVGPVPPDLKARVMGEIATTRQLAPRPAVVSRPARWLRPVLVAAAIVAAVIVGAGVVVAISSGDGTDTELAQVLAAPDAVTVELDGAAGATLRVVHSAEEGRAVLVGSRLDELDDDRTYQLWAISGDTPRSAGVFAPSSAGEVDEAVDAPSSAPDAWAVTIEPDGGSPSPTGDIVFQGTPA